MVHFPYMNRWSFMVWICQFPWILLSPRLRDWTQRQLQFLDPPESTSPKKRPDEKTTKTGTWGSLPQVVLRSYILVKIGVSKLWWISFFEIEMFNINGLKTRNWIWEWCIFLVSGWALYSGTTVECWKGTPQFRYRSLHPRGWELHECCYEFSGLHMEDLTELAEWLVSNLAPSCKLT